MFRLPLTAIVWLIFMSMHAEDMLVHDFDNTIAGRTVALSVSNNDLGTTCAPSPFELSAGGCALSPQRAVHVHGTLGKNTAPWSWVQVQIPLNNNKPVDCTRFKSIRFYAKGNGGSCAVRICRKAVQDASYHQVTVELSPEWTLVELPLNIFTQAWGKKLPPDFHDVFQIQFTAVDYNEPFDFWIDHVVLSEEEVELKHHDYKAGKWFPFAGIDSSRRAGTALDMSRLLDAPAGKHGWLHGDGHDFIFENGKRIRFWGINIVASANFPTHAESEQMAQSLAQMGVNMTRHHHMDAFWTNPNIFGNTGSTLKLDPEAMDRFDYLVAELQKRGIYQYLDFLVNRKAYAADGIDPLNGLGAGWKIEGMFDPRLIKLQEDFIRAFLQHKNPYTGKTYAEDPACCLMEIINEDSLFYMQDKGSFAIEDGYYRAELNRQFAVWLKETYENEAAVRQAWQDPDGKITALQDWESLDAATINSVITFGRGPDKSYTAKGNEDTLRFYYALTLSYYQRMKAVIRDCGSQAPVAGSNHWSSMPVDLLVNAQLDYIDRHAYWAHPEGGFQMAKTRHNHKAMVKDRGLGLIRSLAGRRVLGKPYIITEWQSAAPNDYRADAQFIMAAVGAYQNWNAIQFAYSHSNSFVKNNGDEPLHIFDVLSDPNMLAIWHSAALMLQRGDVRSAVAFQPYTIAADACFNPKLRIPSIQEDAIRHGVGIAFEEHEKPAPVTAEGGRGIVSNEYKQLQLDQRKGLFSVNTERTQGFCGFSRKEAVQLADVTFMTDDPYAIMIVSSLDDQPINSSKHLLLTTLGRSVNSGMIRHANRDRMVDVGQAPVLIERISGSVTLQTNEKASSSEAWYLDHNGQRLKPATVQKNEAGMVITCGEADASFIEVLIP